VGWWSERLESVLSVKVCFALKTFFEVTRWVACQGGALGLYGTVCNNVPHTDGKPFCAHTWQTFYSIYKNASAKRICSVADTVSVLKA